MRLAETPEWLHLSSVSPSAHASIILQVLTLKKGLQDKLPLRVGYLENLMRRFLISEEKCNDEEAWLWQKTFHWDDLTACRSFSSKSEGGEAWPRGTERVVLDFRGCRRKPGEGRAHLSGACCLPT